MYNKLKGIQPVDKQYSVIEQEIHKFTNLVKKMLSNCIIVLLSRTDCVLTTVMYISDHPTLNL